MSIGYYKLNRKVYSHGETKDMYVAKVAYGSEVNTDLLADEIAAATTASPAEVLMWLRALEHQISFHISMGDVVRLDSLGTFSPTISATAQATPEEVTSRTIKSVGVLFRPSGRFKAKVKKAGFHLADRRVFNAERKKKKDEADENSGEAKD